MWSQSTSKLEQSRGEVGKEIWHRLFPSGNLNLGDIIEGLNHRLGYKKKETRGWIET